VCFSLGSRYSFAYAAKQYPERYIECLNLLRGASYLKAAKDDQAVILLQVLLFA